MEAKAKAIAIARSHYDWCVTFIALICLGLITQSAMRWNAMMNDKDTTGYKVNYLIDGHCLGSASRICLLPISG